MQVAINASGTPMNIKNGSAGTEMVAMATLQITNRMSLDDIACRKKSFIMRGAFIEFQHAALSSEEQY